MQPNQRIRWEYATVPLLVHATKQILDNWGDDGWELVAVIPVPTRSSWSPTSSDPRARSDRFVGWAPGPPRRAGAGAAGGRRSVGGVRAGGAVRAAGVHLRTVADRRR